MADKQLEALLQENRRSRRPRTSSRTPTPTARRQTKPKDRLKFWAGFAKELHWFKPWTKVLEWKLPYAKWFVGGKTNVCYNCIDRHLTHARRNKAAIIWEGEPGEQPHAHLPASCTARSAASPTSSRPSASRRATSSPSTCRWSPSSPSPCSPAPASARAHSVVFGGFSADAIADRINDARPSCVITADGGYRRGAVVPLKKNVDEALAR